MSIHQPNHASRTKLEKVLKKRFFYAPAFSIYGGVAGLYDYGPPGCALQANILSLWRNFFILEESMLEVDTTMLTPYEVLESSGHVDRFTDFMVKDIQTGDFYRADHILKAALQKASQGDDKALVSKAKLDLSQLDGMNGEALQAKMTEYQVVSDLGNPLSEVVKFNLMFGTDIGPTGAIKGFMRPETAQGQFVNFKRLLEYNYDRMPFASAQIGRSFRNEISPRAGLLRVREFTMAEIEHYVHPDKKDHPKFAKVAHTLLPLVSKAAQLAGSSDVTYLEIGAAVKQGVVNNETLGYFLVRIYDFLLKIGIHKDKLRFRQHQANEMAHYASDCWDAEIFSSYGWIECVGCADRAAYDLTVHATRTGEKLVARERLDTPVSVTKLKLEANKKKIGVTFKKDAKAVCDALEAMDEHELAKIQKCVEIDKYYEVRVQGSGKLRVPEEMFTIRRAKEVAHVCEYTPSVIEPSFGIGRIMYSLLEHVFWTRPDDEQRCVLSFPAFIAPIKVLVAPIMSQDVFAPAIEEIAAALRCKQLTCQVDRSATSLGKKYARNDEIGIPFSVTVDHRTLEDDTVTIRERDTTHQIRVATSHIPDLIRSLVQGELSWTTALDRFECVTVSDN